MLTKAQQKWASKHDWFVIAFDNVVVVRNYEEVNGQWVLVTRFISDFKELRAWAGY